MKKGFTLIELLAVIVLLAVILVIAVPKIMNIVREAKQSALDSDAGMVSRQLEIYKDSKDVDVESLKLSDLDTYGIKSNKYEGFKAEVINDKVVVTVIREGIIGSNYAGTKIYGVKFEDGESERTDDARGATYSGTTEISSSFDTEEIYSEIEEETDTYGNVFIKIPKFYIKKQKLGSQTWTYQISRTKVDSDYYLPACFVDEASNTILPYILVGKYNASLNNNKLESKTGQTPLVSQTISTFRTYAKNNGAGYQLLDIHVWDVLQTLFYIEFKTLDSQSIMAGYTASSNTAMVNTGGADSITKTGSPNSNTSGTNAMKYRGIENLWGNLWQIVDGVNIKDNVTYVSRDASEYVSDKFDDSYKKVGYINCNTNGYIGELGYDLNHPYVNIPKSVAASYSLSSYRDYYTQSTGNRIVLVGNRWESTSTAGLSSWSLSSTSNSMNPTVVSRLVKTPLE